MLRRTSQIFAVLLILALLGGFSDPVWAQDGKLAGTVTSADDGEPLPGVNVLLVDTQQGVATGSDGTYSIIGITPGTYNVRFSIVGYGTKIVEDVRIVSNRTRTLNVELREEAVQAEEVVVQAERPVVQPDQTTSRTTYTGEEVENLPVADLEGVVSNTAKSYDGFVRGSRRFSTKTVIEGVDVSDSFNRANSISPRNTRAGYGNTVRDDQVKEVNSLFNLGAAGIAEVSVGTGATPAGSPSGTGGVIGVTLQEGRGPWSGSASVRVNPEVQAPGPDSLSFYPEEQVQAWFDEAQQIAEDGNEELAARYRSFEQGKYDMGGPNITANFSLGGAVTEDLGVSVAGQFEQNEGWRPNEFDQRFNAQLKATYDLTDNTRLTGVGLFQDEGRWGGWNNRNYSGLWKFNLESTAQDDAGSYVGSLRLRHVLGENSFITAQYYRKFAQTRWGYPDDNDDGLVDKGEDGEFINFLKTKNIAKYNWIIGRENDPVDKMFYGGPFPPTRSGNVTQPRGEPYRAGLSMPFYSDNKRITNAFKINYQNQLTSHHLIEAGANLEFLTIDHEEARSELYEFSFTLNETLDTNDDGTFDVEPFAPSTWERTPTEASVYVSDKIEYGNLIVNAGLRAEIVDRDMKRIEDHFFPFRRDTVTVDGRRVARNFFDRGEDVKTDVFWEPRVGVSHPIGESAAIYFSYSRSQQLPPYSVLYDLYDGNHTDNQFLRYQNPTQDPITSNDYELGAQWEFVEGWGLDVNAYARSIDNYGRQTFRAQNRVPEGEEPLGGDGFSGFGRHDYETSAGYADIRGIEIQVQRRLLRLSPGWSLGLTGSYTFSTIETNNNTGNKSNFQADNPQIENNKLPFDNADNFEHFPQEAQGGNSTIESGFNRRHRGLLRAILEGPFGVTVGIDARAESGFLFRKVIGTDPRDRELVTAPYNQRIDLRVQKTFDLPAIEGLTVFGDVRNLTDRDNILAFNNSAPDGAQRFQEEDNPGARLVQVDGSSTYGVARNFFFGARVQF
jgi:hypothetical protein